MLGKIGIVVALIAAFLNYGTVLFWLSLAAALVNFTSSYARSYLIGRPEIIKFKQTVRQMEQDGASEEEIMEYMDRPVTNPELDSEAAPTWISIVTLISIVSAFAFFIIGL